jgi:hypothetical protein
MIAKSERLAVLSQGEQYALYGLPDFDDGQRLSYLALTRTGARNWAPWPSGPSLLCLADWLLKAKHAFFRFYWGEVEDD